MKISLVTGSLRKMVNMSVISVITIILLKVVSIFTSRANMKGVRYECDKCEYKATCKSDIPKHKQVKHEGDKYECNQCEIYMI